MTSADIKAALGAASCQARNRTTLEANAAHGQGQALLPRKCRSAGRPARVEVTEHGIGRRIAAGLVFLQKARPVPPVCCSDWVCLDCPLETHSVPAEWNPSAPELACAEPVEGTATNTAALPSCQHTRQLLGIAGDRGSVDAIECKWSEDEFESKTLRLFRSYYPKGRNYLITPLSGEPYTRAYGDLEVTIASPSIWESQKPRRRPRASRNQ